MFRNNEMFRNTSAFDVVGSFTDTGVEWIINKAWANQALGKPTQG